MSVRCGRCSTRETPIYHANVAAVRECYQIIVQEAVTSPQGSAAPEIVYQDEAAFGKKPNRGLWTDKHGGAATGRMINYLKILLAERQPLVPTFAESTEQHRHVNNVIDACNEGRTDLPFDGVSKAIDWMKQQPSKKREPVRSLAPPGSPAQPPAGRYALDTSDGVKFYQVDRPTEGRWQGHVFVKRVFGSPGKLRVDRIKSSRTRDEILRAIAVDTRSAAALFGIKMRACGSCLSPLTNPQSRAAGYGLTCAGKNGWYYPSLREALRILDERGEPGELE